MADACYLGIDGGGSHTVALLADGAGRILGRAEAGPANPLTVGEAEAREALRAAVRAAWASAGLAARPAEVACLGLAGTGREPERQAALRWAAEEGLAARTLVVLDCDLVLAAGTPEGWGLALIAGTGSIAWGRDAQGRTARAGGWGYLLGDEGSGYALGLEALRAVARAADGAGPATALEAAILARWGLAAPQELIARVYRTPFPRPEIAALASLVEEVAGRGDPVAVQLVGEAGAALARLLDAVARRLGLSPEGPLPCALGGGLLVRGRLVREEALRAAAALGWKLEPVVRVEEPALGALRLARGEAHYPPVQSTWEY